MESSATQNTFNLIDLENVEIHTKSVTNRRWKYSSNSKWKAVCMHTSVFW